jgi:hypothetical protein
MAPARLFGTLSADRTAYTSIRPLYIHVLGIFIGATIPTSNNGQSAF